MNKINLCVVVSTLKKSGPLNIVYNLLKYGNREKFNLFLISLSKVPDTDLELNMYKDIKRIGVTIFELNNGRLRGLFKNKTEIETILFNNKIDIVHSHGLRADSIIKSIKSDTSQVTTLHNFPFEDYPLKFGVLKGFLMAQYHFYFIKKIKYSIACSNSLSLKFKEMRKLEVDFIRNGVDLEIFKNEEKCKEKLREILGLPVEKKIFIFVGSLIPRKNPISVIKEFNKFNSDSNYSLVILGDGFLREECKSYFNDNILYRGNVSNVIEYLYASDFFISLSKSEGLPNTVMEALAAGLPVVLSNIPAHNEILKIDEGAGIIIDQENIDSAITILLNKPYNDVSIKAKEIVRNYLNANNMVKNYENYYLKVLNDKV